METTLRQQQILDYLYQNHFASIDELAHTIYVSGATVRREVQHLEKNGFVRSVYGGVMLAEHNKDALPVSLRNKEHSAAKELIAAKAAELIHDNDIVIFDSSSTVRRICKHILNRKNLTVITNNLRVCQELKDTNISVHCTGGTLLKFRDCFANHLAEEYIKQINATSFFFSAQGIMENGDIVDYSEEEISLRKTMLSRAKNKIFLYDSSKIGRDSPFKICNISDTTHVVTDNDMPK